MMLKISTIHNNNQLMIVKEQNLTKIKQMKIIQLIRKKDKMIQNAMSKFNNKKEINVFRNKQKKKFKSKKVNLKT